MKITHALSCLIGICAGLLAGCVSPKDTYQVRQHQVTATNDISDVMIAATEAQLAGDPALLDGVKKSHGENKEAARAEFDRVNTRLRQMEKEFSGLIDGLAKVAGVSPVASAVATQLGNMIKTTAGIADEGKTAATTAQKSADAAANEQKALEAKLGTKIDSLKETIATKSRELEKLEEQTNERQKALVEQFARLDEKVQQEIKENVITELEKNGATKEELEKYRAMTPAQLYALLLAGGGTSLAALLRTLGRSRGQPELNEQWDEIKKLQTELARAESLKAELKHLTSRQEIMETMLAKIGPGKSAGSA
jgi:hypothetical protein